ncbi:hypothetical protein ACFL96_13595 [Thermoproteota archaeon]
MKKKLVCIMVILLIFAALAITGCGEKRSTKVSSTPTSDQKQVSADSSTQSELAAKLSATTLAALQFETVTLKEGHVAINHIIIKNTYTKDKSFKLTNIGSTSLAEFPTSEVDLEAGEVIQVKFNIRADEAPGTYEQGIKVMDERNNAYAFTEVMVIIE